MLLRAVTRLTSLESVSFVEFCNAEFRDSGGVGIDLEVSVFEICHEERPRTHAERLAAIPLKSPPRVLRWLDLEGRFPPTNSPIAGSPFRFVSDRHRELRFGDHLQAQAVLGRLHSELVAQAIQTGVDGDEPTTAYVRGRLAARDQEWRVATAAFGTSTKRNWEKWLGLRAGSLS